MRFGREEINQKAKITMNDFKAAIIGLAGAIFTLLAPIQNFMIAMLILFGINFLVGRLAAVVNNEPWDTKKALMCLLYFSIFIVTACATFVIGHLLGEHDQAVTVVKVYCFLAVYVFGVNIFRNARNCTKAGTSWYRFFDLCYYVLSVKFVEKFSFIKGWNGNDKSVTA